MCLQNQCPRCGYQPSSDELPDNLYNPSSTLESSPDPDDRVKMIKRRAEQLGVAVQQLSQERTNLLRELNEVQSATRIFPVEILVTIFSHARTLTSILESTSRSKSHFQVVLGAVSSHWRQAVWSTPALWTTVTLDVRPSTIRHDTRLLSLYLRNSSALSIELELVFILDHTLKRKHPLEQLKPLSNLLFSIHPNKVSNLQLDGMPFQWMSQLSDRFSRVESLLLGWWPGQRLGPASHPGEVTLHGFPELRQVTIKRVMPQIVLPWSQITTLTCHKLPIDICLHLLTLCPSLVEYRNQLSIAPRISNPLDLDNILNTNKHITLTHLSLLEWCHYPSNICQKLRFLEFPALRTLLLADAGQSWTSSSVLHDLLQDAPGVADLTLAGNSRPTFIQDIEKWREIFTTCTPHLTNLRLVLAPLAFFEVLDPASALGRGSTLNASGLSVLPNLEFLYVAISYECFDRDLARSEDSPFLRMLENRRKESQRFGCVSIDTRQRFEWSEGVRRRLTTLIKDGLRLRVRYAPPPESS